MRDLCFILLLIKTLGTRMKTPEGIFEQTA